MSVTTLNLAQVCPSTRALGPGNRFVVWVQGCPFACKNCVAPDWIPFRRVHVVEARDLAAAIVQQPGLDGITISGGEPMMQAGRLAETLKFIKKERPALNVIVFSGFTRSQLIWDEAMDLLKHTDLLIDGQYIEQKNDGSGLRGSTNQKFHFLSERLLPFKNEILGLRPGMEFHILDDGVLLAGIPAPDFSW